MAISHKLLLALEATAPPVHTFCCPRTELALEVRLLSVDERARANAAATAEWGDRALVSRFDEEDYSRLMIMHALAVACSHEGVPVGLDFIRALNERTVTRYAAEYSTLEDEFDPPLESWTDVEVEAFVEGIKKKDRASLALLRTFDGNTLIALLLSTVGQLGSFETSTSSPASSTTSSADEPAPA